jgi:hypothetical protein
MEIEGPATLSDMELERIGKRIGILDRLIITRKEQSSDLIDKGLELEAQLRRENAHYTSQLGGHILEFRRLSALYGH